MSQWYSKAPLSGQTNKFIHGCCIHAIRFIYVWHSHIYFSFVYLVRWYVRSLQRGSIHYVIACYHSVKLNLRRYDRCRSKCLYLTRPMTNVLLNLSMHCWCIINYCIHGRSRDWGALTMKFLPANNLNVLMSDNLEGTYLRWIQHREIRNCG